LDDMERLGGLEAAAASVPHVLQRAAYRRRHHREV